MNFLRSERFAAALLLVAAVLGLVIANLPFGPAFVDVKDAHLDIPWLGLDLSAGHWISDGLLAIFFFIVAVELKRELVIGELNSLSKALLPAIAAVGGVVVPAADLHRVHRGHADGRRLADPDGDRHRLRARRARGVRHGSCRPACASSCSRSRCSTTSSRSSSSRSSSRATPNLAALGFATIAIALFGAVSRLMKPRSNWILSRRPQWPIMLVLVVLAVLAWYFVYRSGVHATIAGVALGLVMARRPGGRAAHALEPWSNGVILPLFAFTAAMVPVPQVSPSELDPAFWGILVGLPVGKIVGITLAGWLGGLIARPRPGTPLTFGDLVVVGALGGIGFTVSLLMNELAFAGLPEVADEGTLAVLLGSGVAIVLSAIVVTVRSRQYRRRGARGPAAVRALARMARWRHLRALSRGGGSQAVADASGAGAAASGIGKIAVTSLDTQSMRSASPGSSPLGDGNGTRITSFCAKCLAPG